MLAKGKTFLLQLNQFEAETVSVLAAKQNFIGLNDMFCKSVLLGKRLDVIVLLLGITKIVEDVFPNKRGNK